METKLHSLVLSLLVMASLGLSCKADEEDTYIPLVSNFWTDVASQDHTFTFTAAQEGVFTGTFTGTEAAPDYAVNPTLRGTFSHRNISFTVARPGGDATFTGRFVTDNLIDFGALKIKRN